MVASNLTLQQRGWFDVLDDWLNATALSLWAGLDYFFSHCLSCNWWSYWHNFRYERYTHGLASSYLEGANFLTAAVSTLLTLWVILFFYFGVLAQGDFVRWCQLGGLWAFVALHGGLRSYRFYAQAVWIARLVGIRPYNAMLFLVLLLYSSLYFSSTLSDNPLGSLRRVSVSRRYSASFSSSRAS